MLYSELVKDVSALKNKILLPVNKNDYGNGIVIAALNLLGFFRNSSTGRKKNYHSMKINNR
jgi:hypothetical protein